MPPDPSTGTEVTDTELTDTELTNTELTDTEVTDTEALPSPIRPPARRPAGTAPPEGGSATPAGSGAGASPPDQPWTRWVVRPIVIYLVSRAITWATLAVTTPFTHKSILQEVDRWDSRWFLRAAIEGWPRHLPHHAGHVAGSTIAFFPLFPLAIRWLSHVPGLTPLAAGIILTTVSGLVAMIGVWALARRYTDGPSADRATLLVALFPGSFVLSMVYSEGFALTFLAFGLLALLQRRWLLAGLLGLLASATTPVALAFEVSCLWCAYREVADHRNWRAVVAPVLAPMGFLGYQVWIWRHTGSLNAWRLTERGGWKSYPSFVYALHTVTVVVRDPIATNMTDNLLFICTILVVVAAVVAVRSSMPTPMLLYGLSAAVLGMISAPIGLRPRFVFLAFPLIVAVGVRVRGRAYAALAVVSAVLLIGITAFEVSSWRIFP